MRKSPDEFVAGYLKRLQNERNHFERNPFDHLTMSEFSQKEIIENAARAKELDSIGTLAGRILGRATEYEPIRNGYPPVTYFHEDFLRKLEEKTTSTSSPLYKFSKNELKNLIPALEILNRMGDVRALNPEQRKAIKAGSQIASALEEEKIKNIDEILNIDASSPPLARKHLKPAERDKLDRYEFAKNAYQRISEDFEQLAQHLLASRSMKNSNDTRSR